MKLKLYIRYCTYQYHGWILFSSSICLSNIKQLLLDLQYWNFMIIHGALVFYHFLYFFIGFSTLMVEFWFPFFFLVTWFCKVVLALLRVSPPSLWVSQPLYLSQSCTVAVNFLLHHSPVLINTSSKFLRFWRILVILVIVYEANPSFCGFKARWLYLHDLHSRLPLDFYILPKIALLSHG